jgi:hypothetical protein
MNLKNLNIAFLIILILSVILLPVLAGASIIGFSEEDNFAGEDDFLIFDSFWVTWMGMPVHQMSVLLGLAMSMFTLFVVYLGGRSKHRRFNDRTLDHIINLLMVRELKTALTLRRAVFNFRFFILHLLYNNNYLSHVFHPHFIPNQRSITI